MSRTTPAVRNGTPAYRRIQLALESRIHSGELKPGDLIDSERELARKSGVSLMTARHALKELEREGLVIRRASSGTYVAPPRVEFNKLTGFTEQLTARGLLPRSRVLATALTVNDDISARLGLTPGSELARIDRLRFAGDEPLAIETCYLSSAQFPDLLERLHDRRSLFGVIEDGYGIKLAYADEEMDATNADARAADLLKVHRGAALLRIRQLLFTTSGDVVSYALGLYRSDRHSMKLRRYR